MLSVNSCKPTVGYYIPFRKSCQWKNAKIYRFVYVQTTIIVFVILFLLIIYSKTISVLSKIS